MPHYPHSFRGYILGDYLCIIDTIIYQQQGDLTQGEFLKSYFCMSKKHYFSMPEKLGLAIDHKPTFLVLILFHFTFISEE